MARMLIEDDYNAKRNEILNFALSLVYSKGYAQMTVQDIMAGLQISKGAFYHYFDSKQALLEALVERMGQTAWDALWPVVQDPTLSAIEKFRRYFEAGAQWKSSQKEFIVKLMSMWYTDDNATIRQKIYSASLKRTPLLLEPIIRQGIEEGIFTTRYPEEAAIILAGLGLAMADKFSEWMLFPSLDEAGYQKATQFFDAYVEAYERILGAPAGSLKVFDLSSFKEWFAAGEPQAKPQEK